MKHQIGRKKLNLRAPHRRSMIRNQMIHLINYGFLQTTKPRIKEVQKAIEKLVTIARNGWEFNTIRKVQQKIPYSKKAAEKLIKEIAPKYQGRPGGYTRAINLGRRQSDTAPISRLEWI